MSKSRAGEERSGDRFGIGDRFTGPASDERLHQPPQSNMVMMSARHPHLLQGRVLSISLRDLSREVVMTEEPGNGDRNLTIPSLNEEKTDLQDGCVHATPVLRRNNWKVTFQKNRTDIRKSQCGTIR